MLEAGRHCAFESPPPAEPRRKAMTFSTQLCRPFGNELALSVPLDPSVAAVVSVLYSMSRPTAIVRRVPLVIVSAFKGVSRRWSCSHVGTEIVKGEPSLAHANTSRSVVLELVVIWIAATLNHMRPRAVFRRVAHTVPLAIKALSAALAARHASAVSQCTRAHGLLRSTGATTVPVGNLSQTFVDGVRKPKNAPASIIFVG